MRRVAKEHPVDSAAAVIALLALLVSLVSAAQSCAASRASNKISEASLEIERRAQRATIEIGFRVASSPDLLDEEDRRWEEQHELSARPIQTRTLLEAIARHGPKSTEKYLFVFVLNRGPADAESVIVSDIRWEPRTGSGKHQPPANLPPLGILKDGQFYALLVDILQSRDIADPLRNAGFSTLSLRVTYKDQVGVQHQVPFSLQSSAAQAQVPSKGQTSQPPRESTQAPTQAPSPSVTASPQPMATMPRSNETGHPRPLPATAIQFPPSFDVATGIVQVAPETWPPPGGVLDPGMLKVRPAEETRSDP